MQLSPVSSIHSEEICSLSELFLHSEGEKPCAARAHLINHPDKWSLGQKKIQNGNGCALGSMRFVEFCWGNVLTNWLKYKCLGWQIWHDPITNFFGSVVAEVAPSQRSVQPQQLRPGVQVLDQTMVTHRLHPLPTPKAPCFCCSQLFWWHQASLCLVSCLT